MVDYGRDIYTEPDGDPNTLANLGPLGPMAGTWEGTGTDEHPAVNGPESHSFHERYDLQPTDPQTNGPQLFYGLRYHTHVVKPGEVETFHDQVGYWLWEPAARLVVLTLAIPRGQVLMASGPAEPDATEFTVTAKIGADDYGILSNPFLNRAFRTVKFTMHVTINPDGTWSYDEVTHLQLPGDDAPFKHTDRNRLSRVGAPTLNPLARPTNR